MITFGLNYDVKPEFVEEFLRVSRDVLQLLPTLPGHEETRLYSEVSAPTSFLIYSKWKSNEDFQAFIQSETFKQVQTMGRGMLNGAPRHQIYEARKFR